MNSFTVFASLALVATTYLGGIASIAGAIVAGIVADGGVLTALIGSKSSAATYAVNGLMLMVIAVVYPDGLIAGARSAVTWLMARRPSRRRSPAAPSPPAPAPPPDRGRTAGATTTGTVAPPLIDTTGGAARAAWRAATTAERVARSARRHVSWSRSTPRSGATTTETVAGPPSDSTTTKGAMTTETVAIAPATPRPQPPHHGRDRHRNGGCRASSGRRTSRGRPPVGALPTGTVDRSPAEGATTEPTADGWPSGQSGAGVKKIDAPRARCFHRSGGAPVGVTGRAGDGPETGGSPHGRGRLERAGRSGRRGHRGGGVRRHVHAAPTPRDGAVVAGVRAGQRGGRHLVLEPLPRCSLRHREHGVQLPVRRRPPAGVVLDGALRPPARDPRVREPRRRPLLAARRHRVRHQRAVGDLRRGRRSVDGDGGRPERRARGDRAVRGDGHRLPVVGQHAGLPGHRFVRGRDLPHRSLAPRRGRLQRQAGRGDRHRVVGRAVDPDHRGAGRPAHRLPAHRGVRRPGRERAARPGRGAGGQGALPRVPRGQQPAGPGLRLADAGQRADGGRGHSRGAAGPVRAPLGAGRPHVPRRLRRPPRRPGVQRSGRRVRAIQDPRDRRRPGRRRAAQPAHAHRSQAPLPRHQLLRDLQPTRTSRWST